MLKKQDAGLGVQEEARRSESRGVVPHASAGSERAGLGGPGLEGAVSSSCGLGPVYLEALSFGEEVPGGPV